MTDCLVFDIETAPDPRIWDDAECVEEIREGIEPDGRIKDPLKIAADIDAKFDKLKGKSALSWTLGKIRAIGWSPLYDDGEPLAVASEDEAEVIATFSAALFDLPATPAIGGA